MSEAQLTKVRDPLREGSAGLGARIDRVPGFATSFTCFCLIMCGNIECRGRVAGYPLYFSSLPLPLMANCLLTPDFSLCYTCRATRLRARSRSSVMSCQCARILPWWARLASSSSITRRQTRSPSPRGPLRTPGTQGVSQGADALFSRCGSWGEGRGEVGVH